MRINPKWIGRAAGLIFLALVDRWRESSTARAERRLQHVAAEVRRQAAEPERPRRKGEP